MKPELLEEWRQFDEEFIRKTDPEIWEFYCQHVKPKLEGAKTKK